MSLEKWIAQNKGKLALAGGASSMGLTLLQMKEKRDAEKRLAAEKKKNG